LSCPGFLLFLIVPLALIAAFGYYLFRDNYFGFLHGDRRSQRVMTWLTSPQAHPEWAVVANQRCGNAPFSLPTDGYIGYLWGDSFRVGHRHQGLDIFGGTDVALTPVYAAYPGYLTRQADWKSALIIRIPDDPLHPGRQIWTYYTHMASPQGESYISADFPPGTLEQPVKAGRLLGYQGNYSGDPGNPVGVHLHFSIVLDDGQGHYLNELQIQNTLDPSPYLGLPLDASQNLDQIPVCP
jgi:murein DD-endopeptidase MepM/ murein hydrolase activator NlpD